MTSFFPVNGFIKIEDLTKTYVMDEDVQVKALNHVSLAIEKGAFIATMGPSGSGKSTLMHILGGLDRPTTGNIRVGDMDIQNLDEHDMAIYRRKMVGFIFQTFNLIPTMSALENVALPLRLNGVDRKERSERARQLLVSVGLEDRLYHRPTQLSGGQQQRVAIARSLANDPPIILADEPTGNLDTKSGAVVMNILAELHDQGRTLFMVTHDPRMEQYVDQVIHMLDGQIISE